MELPPHARRRGALRRPYSLGLGITSACAEKSWCALGGVSFCRNYLRMRGEESSPERKIVAALELPPHARRRGMMVSRSSRVMGITSACAEKRGTEEAA